MPGPGQDRPSGIRWIVRTEAPAATILVRCLVGAVFLSEGIQKLLYPAELGAGRLAKIGFAHAELLGPLVAATEIAGGLLVLVGGLTRVGAAALAGVMCVALVSTKLPILLGRDLGPFRLRPMERYGFWAAAHEGRTDWAMLLGACFLVVVGGGRWSLDALLGRRGPSVS